MRTLTVLGSTGSIGTNTLDVVRRNRELYRIYALVAGRNVETLTQQIVEFRPQVAAVATPEGLARLIESLAASRLPVSLSGADALPEVSVAVVMARPLATCHPALGLATHKEVIMRKLMEARQCGAELITL